MLPDIGCRVFDVLSRFLGPDIQCLDTKKKPTSSSQTQGLTKKDTR